MPARFHYEAQILTVSALAGCVVVVLHFAASTANTETAVMASNPRSSAFRFAAHPVERGKAALGAKQSRLGIARQLESRAKLWADGVQAPAIAELAFPAHIQHVPVERSDTDDTDRFQFLHDPAIEFHLGRLFAAWYNCPKQEIVGESLIRGRRSSDGGLTWSALDIIAEDTQGHGVHYVPAQFLSHERGER
jgi:hypothetical protein